MRAEADVAGVPRTRPEPPPHRPVQPPGRRLRLDGFEIGVLAVFGAVSAWVLGLDLFQVIAHGRVWTGTDGVYLVDQMQYLSWIQSASDHVLSANLFVLHPTSPDYYQPAITI